jgi:queuine/archaeosine tRNA-ribosyltransferase
VVSKGIHELSEDECLKYFSVLKDGIVMILDDIVAKKEKEKAEAEYKKSLGKIISDLK